MLNFIIGYLIAINIIPMILIYVDYTFKIKIKEDVLDFIYLLIGIFGGGIGIIITSRMFEYKRDSKILKNWVPIILFLQIVIAFFVVIKAYDIKLFDFKEFLKK